MADNTKIEWTDATWNPVTGCSVVSAGCKHCYAMKLAGTRLKHHPSRAGLTIDTAAGPVWNGEVRFNEQWLDQPMRWRRPRRIFVCAHGDLFHEAVPDEWVDRVFAMMAACPQHTFQVLTKRPARMLRYLNGADLEDRLSEIWRGLTRDRDTWRLMMPLPNVWLGVSVEDQTAADLRIPLLLQAPTAVRWISAEPLLGPVNLPVNLIYSDILPGGGVRERKAIEWVVVGGESGPNARPMHPKWARSLRDQCADAGVPMLFKQHGEWIGDDDIDNCNLSAPAIADADQYFRRVPWPSGGESYRVGKKAAGRLLDGVQHDGYPILKW